MPYRSESSSSLIDVIKGEKERVGEPMRGVAVLRPPSGERERETEVM